MKNKFLKCIVGILLGSFLATAMSPAASVQAALSSKEQVEGMTLAAENDDIAMYYDEETAQVSFLYKDSGRVVNAKELKGDGSATFKDYQKSEIIVEYYAEKKSGGKTIITTNKMAIDIDLEKGQEPQVKYELVKNGLKISFCLKENKLSLDVVPKLIPTEKFEKMILVNLNEEERKLLLTVYQKSDRMGGYYRTKDGYGNMRQDNIKKIRDYVYRGEYTEQDMEIDNLAYGYESTWSSLEVNISMIYELDGNDVLVKIPTNEITTNSEEVIISEISVNRYFTAAHTSQDGYIVVPDGIGAIINFNNGLLKAVDYKSRIYGNDTLIDADKYSEREFYANLPMYGMVYDDYAILSIVEEGDTMAELNTQVSGKGDSYNKAYWDFILTEQENVAASADSAVSVNKYTGDAFEGDIVVRYQMLEMENANYFGIAKAYQNYLIGEGVLDKTERKANASLYLEVLGSVKESKNFMGIPYQGVSSLTTFAEFKQMLEYFKISGVKDLETELVGWMNDGDNHSALTNIKIDSVMGSKSELARITEFAHEYEFGFYLGMNLQKVYASNNLLNLWATSSFASKYASKFLSSEYAQVGTTKLGVDNLRINQFSAYLVSPAKLKDYATKVLAQLEKYEIEGVSLKDIGSLLVADYNNKKNVSRENAADIENAVIGMFAEDYKVMLSNPDGYAWKYADAITDLPQRSNEYTVFAHDIPLLPLVLDGCVSYSTTALNYDTQKEISEMILKCIETRMNPKFYLMYAEMDELANTEEHFDELSINYNTWRKDIVKLYEEYNEFYKLVKDAEFASHETLAKNVVKVTYTNGVTAYVNYTKSDFKVKNGPEIKATSYLVVEE